MASKRKRSDVWNHFSEVEPKKAECIYCAQTLSITSGNVGNLNRHIKSKHPSISISCKRDDSVATPVIESEFVSVKQDLDSPPILASPEYMIEHTQQEQSTLSNFVCVEKPISTSTAQAIDKQLVKMICKGHHSLRMVEEPEFIKLLDMVSQTPDYVLPTKKTLSDNLIPELYNETFEKIQERIDSVKALCITTDSWMSHYTKEAYIAVTAHYINYNMEMCSDFLDCIRYEEKHTSENLAQFLKDCFTRWNIVDKVTTIVPDNAPNVSAAIRLGGWRSIDCFAHQINLVVKKGLEEIGDVVLKVKRIVEFYEHNTKAKYELHEIQRQMGLQELMLKQDVETRWNSTYGMLNRFIEMKEAVLLATAILRSDLVIPYDELEVIEKCLLLLKIFYDITTDMSIEKSVTLSKVIVYCKMMTNHVNNHVKDATYPPMIQNLLKTLQQQITKRFSDIESSLLHAETTVLDPRFKQFGFLNEVKYQNTIEQLRQKISSSTNTTNTIVTTQPQTTEKKSNMDDDLWSEFDNEVRKAVPQNSTDLAIIEFDKYLKEELLDRKSDPLKWWHERRNIYPNLYNYVFKRLCIVATSVPCEIFFSKTGEILRARRTLLESEEVSQLLFLHHNM